MKKILLYIICITCACVMDLKAQSKSMSTRNNSTTDTSQKTDSIKEDPCVPINDGRYCWTLDPLTGLKYSARPDTSYLGLGNKQSMESKALALVHTGNLYSPHLVQSYFDRRTDHDFIFLNAYNLFRVDPSQQIYYNSKMPCTILRYSKEGGGLQTNDHLMLNFFGNFNKQIGIGSNLDYVYARGEYDNTATKPLNWSSYVYYEDDLYKAYLSFTLSKLANQESGGIENRDHVLHPDRYKKTFTDPKNMQTNLLGTWNDTDQRQIHFQHSYDLGNWVERTDPQDSSVWDEFIPVASIFHSMDFEYLHHNYIMETGADALENKFFKDSFYNPLSTHDSTSYRGFSTYAGIRLNEGFSKFSQVSLAAFIGYELQNYRVLQDTTKATLDSIKAGKDSPFIHRKHQKGSVWIGGQMSRHLSSLLTLDATARFAIAGEKSGNIDVHGTVHSTIPLTSNDSVLIEASALFENTNTPYLMRTYYSNHFKWSDKLKDQQRLRIEGRLTYPRTQTSLRFSNESITNYRFFGADGTPANYEATDGKSIINVTAFEIRQSLWAGKWLQWDNAALVQYSTNDSVLALPTFSIESDLSLHFKIAKTLAIQAGVTAYYYTKYYTPNYQPAIQQFCPQYEIKCGDYPVLNGYLNCNLKRIKFFLTVHNMLGNSITNDMFIMPQYPHQSRRIEYGMILDLQN